VNVSAPFIRRPVGTSLLAAGLFLLGVVAYFSLPIAPLPRVDFPTINVNASLPGIDPATAASALAAPLERRLGKIPGVMEMTSGSSLGGASITVQFDLDRDIDDAARDVQAAINASLHDLPTNLPSPPTYRKLNPADAPVLILAMTSDTVPLGSSAFVNRQLVACHTPAICPTTDGSPSGTVVNAVAVPLEREAPVTPVTPADTTMR